MADGDQLLEAGEICQALFCGFLREELDECFDDDALAVGSDGRVQGLAVAVALEGQFSNGPVLCLLLLSFLEEEDELVDDLNLVFGVGHEQPQILLYYFIDIVAGV